MGHIASLSNIISLRAEVGGVCQKFNKLEYCNDHVGIKALLCS